MDAVSCTVERSQIAGSLPALHYRGDLSGSVSTAGWGDLNSSLDVARRTARVDRSTGRGGGPVYPGVVATGSLPQSRTGTLRWRGTGHSVCYGAPSPTRSAGTGNDGHQECDAGQAVHLRGE